MLLDHCVPAPLAAALHGLRVDTVGRIGWAELADRALLERCAGRYDAVVTVDGRFASCGPIPAAVAVVRLVARSNRLGDLNPLLPALRTALERPARGRVTVVAASR